MAPSTKSSDAVLKSFCQPHLGGKDSKIIYLAAGNPGVELTQSLEDLSCAEQYALQWQKPIFKVSPPLQSLGIDMHWPVIQSQTIELFRLSLDQYSLLMAASPLTASWNRSPCSRRNSLQLTRYESKNNL